MKISEIILEAEKPKLSRQDAERMFNQLRAERKPENIPTPPSEQSGGAKVHTIRKPKPQQHIEPPTKTKRERVERERASLTSINVQMDERHKELMKLKDQYPQLVERALVLAYSERQELPKTLTGYDWRKTINDTTIGGPEKRQSATIDGLKSRIADLQEFLKYPMRVQKIKNKWELI